MNSLLLAMRVARYTPRSLVRGGARLGATVGWLRAGKSRQRLEDNLHRVTGLAGKELSRLSHAGMVSAARYYAEVLEMPRITSEQVRARLRFVNEKDALAAIKRGPGAVVALGHSGNWDLVGAKTVLEIAPVTSVAEVLKPREVFDQFVELRAKIGLRIYGHEGSRTFRELLREAKSGEERIIALLADRDISGTGTEVEMFGHRVKVAPGPAALAIASGLPLLTVTSYYERLRGGRRRAARSKWGLVMEFGPVFDPADFKGADGVQALSQAWAEWLGSAIEKHPQDWHMLQRFGWVE